MIGIACDHFPPHCSSSAKALCIWVSLPASELPLLNNQLEVISCVIGQLLQTNAYENNIGTYESITGADDAYETHLPKKKNKKKTSRYTNHNKTPDDDRFGRLQGTSYRLLKTYRC